MRPKFLVLIIVMTLMTTFLSSIHKMSATKQDISQTGNVAAVAAVPTYTPVPTVLAQPVGSSYPGNERPVVSNNPAPVIAPAVDTATSGPALDRFAQSVVNGKADQVVGVYVAGTLALPVLQQPADNPNFVSTQPEVVTQFAAAGRFRTIGLLAHNYLAGTHFTDLKISQVVVVVFGNGTKRYYQISKVERYQALSPESPQSDFVDLNNGQNTRMTAGDVFQRIYTQGDVVIFQTCILNNGDPSWGRLFITATPMQNAPVSMSPRFYNWF